MLYLSVHAAGHRFDRLSWLCDIKLLLHRYPGLDWPTLIARARSLHVLAPLLFSVTLPVSLPTTPTRLAPVALNVSLVVPS